MSVCFLGDAGLLVNNIYIFKFRSLIPDHGIREGVTIGGMS